MEKLEALYALGILLFGAVASFITFYKKIVETLSELKLKFDWRSPIKSGFYKAAKSRSEVPDIIRDLHTDIEGCVDVAIGKCTNGNGIPTFGSILNQATIFSTNAHTLNAYGVKQPVDANFYKFFSKVIESGHCSITEDDLHSEGYKDSFKELRVGRANMFLIGLESASSFIMYVSTYDDRKLSSHEMFKIRTAIKRISGYVKKKYS
tara:strand:+ start:1376 stop:1996 length:621 start_codon:yes stop_codon:yes gene_type:complete